MIFVSILLFSSQGNVVNSRFLLRIYEIQNISQKSKYTLSECERKSQFLIITQTPSNTQNLTVYTYLGIPDMYLHGNLPYIDICNLGDTCKYLRIPRKPCRVMLSYTQDQPASKHTFCMNKSKYFKLTL